MLFVERRRVLAVEYKDEFEINELTCIFHGSSDFK
jgi:hypothetical protein